MSAQNIYDDPTFFAGYQKLRENTASPNLLVEKPAFFALCPDFNGKTVLDLGCGYGENCMAFAALGAKTVVGIDVSEKMLQVAKEENAHKNVSFLQLPMEDLSPLQGPFDVVISSLAFHYIQDFPKLLAQIHPLLAPHGLLIFSQEHPLTTALQAADYWTKDNTGAPLHYNLTHYMVEGVRQNSWLGTAVTKYHRSFSSIVTALVQAGFVIESVVEPIPTQEIMAQHPQYQKSLHKPDFLLLRVRKG